jgi:hypothetical protein
MFTKHFRFVVVHFCGLWMLACTTNALSKETNAAESPPLSDLLERADVVIKRVQARELISERHTPWVIMHAVIAYEKEIDVHDSATKEKVNALEYLRTRAKYGGKRIFRVDAKGRPAMPTRGLRYGLKESFKVQDHADQFLMAFADAGVSLDDVIATEGGKNFKVADMLEASKSRLKKGQELGWTLVAWSQYLPMDGSWKAESGRSYSIENLVALAIKRDPRRETEGGPHHLYGIAIALEQYQREHEGELTGTWKAAREYLDRYVALARKNQQDDGQFSVAMFRSPRKADSPKQLVWATGHTIEWLCVALTAEQLKEPWVKRGVARLLQEMEKHPADAFSEGGLYHAVHALRRYKQEVGK